MARYSSLHQWDPRSDQPSRIRDRKAKLRIRLASLPAHLKMLLTAMVVGPRILWRYAGMALPGTTSVPTEGFFGLCVTIDRIPEQLPVLVRELGIDRLKVRVHIGNTEHLPAYREFLASLAPAQIVVSILQDRAHVEEPEMAMQQIRKIFTALAPFVDSFKIGNAVNRTKWGFYSVDEYLAFYKRVQALRDQDFPQIQLMSGGVIDFEMLPIIRSLFSAHGCRFDQVASQLYIDRRGAPESKQTGHFDLRNKIRMIAAALLSSKQPARRIIISETNWPLKDQGRYAPASGDCCVSEADYADYMVRYYLLALSTGLVETVYWHQLVAQGYGLVTAQSNSIVRREAFQALKTLVKLLKGSSFTRYRVIEDYYEMTFDRDGHVFSVIWSDKPVPFPAIDYVSLIDQQGHSVADRPALLSGQVYYVNTTLG